MDETPPTPAPIPLPLKIEEEEEEEEEEPLVGPSPPPAGPPTGRYVKLEQTVARDDDGEYACDKNKVITLAEVEVLDADGTNVASNKTVSGSSERSAEYGYVNLTDGNKSNYTHTGCPNPTDDTYDYLQIDLGSDTEIKTIIITNRSVGQDKAIGIKAAILAADGTTVVKETPVISTAADTYTLTFPENVWS